VRILIASAICPDAVTQLRRDHDVVCAFGAAGDRLKALVADREVLVFRSGVTIDADLMGRAPDLKLLIRAGSGLDNLDLGYAAQRGIRLMRIPEPGARAVAELSFGLMLGLARQILLADQALRQGRWLKNDLEGHLLGGKTLGILGAGNIGSLVGRMAAAWDMRVLACVAHPTPERAAEFARQGMRLTSLDEMLADADFLSVHVPLSDATRNLVDAGTLARMKRGSFIVNLARGGVVNEAALLSALQSGHLRGAGLDVHEQEGPGRVSPLAGLANVLLTPHIGASTVDTQRAIGERVLEIVAASAAAPGSADSTGGRPVPGRGLAVAVVGADGAGKSSVIHSLLRETAVPFRYVYMGASIESANYSLPSSRWLTRRKRRLLRPVIRESSPLPPAALMTASMQERLGGTAFIKAAGFVNRVLEEWYRQCVVWIFRWRGYVVLCDRHFLFEYCPDSPAQQDRAASWTERAHAWLLRHLYPRPDLTLFLDAPAETLHARKPEWALAHLTRQREGILAQSRVTPEFVTLDANEPLERVVAAAYASIAARRNR
jgi:phosphoglycerate dehydrogenase-like enzyme/thymidylate kinase